MSPLDKLRHLVRHATVEPDRGLPPTDAPEPMRSRAVEIPVRCAGSRFFLAADEDGELCGLALMHPNGDIQIIDAGLLGSIHESEVLPRLRLA